ncbi:MAG: DNA alkylation repair protein [Pseudomonadales bacterium]|nr:DNA alkylation repair protein [Pseudomonadales bacterium]MCP5183082.1 DNA alkylation repair protein [Pseudomonadales bacterium]
MAIRAETGFSLKDQLFNAETVAALASNLEQAWPRFDRRAYEQAVLKQFPALELKARIHCLVEVLGEHLPRRFDHALRILRDALPPPLDPTRTDDDFGEFIWSVPGEYVARHGCTPDRVDAALAFLRDATQRFTAESPIRPFLLTFPDATCSFVQNCTTDANYHVRRLASEGIRPYLPWAQRVELPVPFVLDVLDRLHADSTRYVTRSVANNLNDLSRKSPDAVIAALHRWREAKRQQADELAWMTRHATRTLAKAHHPAAMALMGYADDAHVTLHRFTANAQVRVGDTLTVSASLTPEADQKLKLLLRVDFLKANGRHAGKTFALKEVDARAGERLTLTKRIAFRPATTRTLYPGRHHVALLANGQELATRTFDLVV